MNLRKFLEIYSFNQPELPIERTPLLNFVISTTSLALLYIILSKAFTNIVLEDPRFNNKPNLEQENKKTRQDNIVSLPNFRKSFIVEDQIYIRPQFYQAPGLKQIEFNQA
jgi:hypothetical protein